MGGHTRKFLLSCISISILTAYLFYLLSLILLFLSAAANLSTASSRSSLLARSLSMARSAKLFSLSCPIVALRCVFSLFKHENERSHDAVETPSVNVICRTFSRSMKASLTGNLILLLAGVETVTVTVTSRPYERFLQQQLLVCKAK